LKGEYDADRSWWSPGWCRWKRAAAWAAYLPTHSRWTPSRVTSLHRRCTSARRVGSPRVGGGLWWLTRRLSWTAPHTRGRVGKALVLAWADPLIQSISGSCD